MQVGANLRLNFVLFILYVYIFVSLMFMFLIIRTLGYPYYLLKSL